MYTPHDLFEEPSCAFEHVLVLVDYRDLARARKAVADCPPLFSLHDWTADERKAFWVLLHAVESETVHSDRYGEKIDPIVWRGVREGLRQIESLCEQGAVPFRFFIVEAEKAMRGVRVSTDDLRKFAESKKLAVPATRQGFAERLARVSKEMRPVGQLPLKIERKLEKRRDAHTHPRIGPSREALLADNAGKASLAPPAKPDLPKKLTPAQLQELVAVIQKQSRAPGAPTGRDGWQAVANQHFGRRIRREDVRVAIEKAEAKGESGRPPKSGQ
jgi:hypothetical protein